MLRAVALAADPLRLDRHHDGAGGEEDEDRRHQTGHDAVPRDRLAEEVRRARRVREDRLVREVALDVLGERVRARVAPVRLFLQRLADDRLEVGVER